MVAGIEAALILLKKTENDPRTRGGAAVFVSVDHRPASLLQSFMAEQAAAGKGTQEPLESGGYEAKFDERDAAGWAFSLRAWWRRYMDKHTFLPPPSEPQNLEKNEFRLALLGDWGTGLYGAPLCATSISENKPAYDVLLHLGDVYYAGTEREVESRFLKLWPNVSGAISRATNSNHEMYSGGNAYFRQTLAAFHQSSSLFAFSSKHWLLTGKQEAGWQFTMRQLYEKSGSLARFSDFAIDIRRVVKVDHLPEYTLELEKNGEGEEIVYITRRSLLPPEDPRFEPERFSRRRAMRGIFSEPLKLPEMRQP
jgi:hypothetical protein